MKRKSNFTKRIMQRLSQQISNPDREHKSDFQTRNELAKPDLTSAIQAQIRLSKDSYNAFDIRTIAKRTSDPSLADVLAEHPELSKAAAWLRLPNDNRSNGIIWN